MSLSKKGIVTFIVTEPNRELYPGAFICYSYLKQKKEDPSKMIITKENAIANFPEFFLWYEGPWINEPPPKSGRDWLENIQCYLEEDKMDFEPYTE
jgi:hypothetical protein